MSTGAEAPVVYILFLFTAPRINIVSYQDNLMTIVKAFKITEVTHGKHPILDDIFHYAPAAPVFVKHLTVEGWSKLDGVNIGDTYLNAFDMKPGWMLIVWPTGLLTARTPETFERDFTLVRGEYYSTSFSSM